ncbi:MAG: DNA repair protein RadC [Akkermansia sp.]|nr:DNA repair protein RadC [Akkermansia sp.]
MSESEQAETLRLKDMAEEERPREKMLQKGRAALSDEELIAIFLRTGLRGCNVLELAARLKRSAGSLVALGRMEAREIMACCKGIGAAKAATLAAVFELGHRAVEEDMQRAVIDEPQVVYRYLSSEMVHYKQEVLVVLLLDAKRRLIRKCQIAKGTANMLISHPRDIFREAINCNAHAIVLAHNHPSGDPTPSKADCELTKVVSEASEVLRIRLIDHVIIGSPGNGRSLPYYSFASHGYIS